MKLQLFFGLALSVIATQASASKISCKTIRAFNDANPDKSYFRDSSKSVAIPAKYEEAALRKAVAAYYRLQYEPSMSLEKVKELGEDAYTQLAEDPKGNLYLEANVGYGGGNSASYFYDFGSLEFAAHINDGTDCVTKGSTTEFPVDLSKSLFPVRTEKIVCTKKTGSFPIQTVALDIAVHNDQIYDDLATFAVTGDKTFPGFTVSSKPQLTSISARSTKKEGLHIGASSEEISSTGNPKWQLSYSFVINEKGPRSGIKASGTLFPLVRGGRWSADAKKLSAEFSCQNIPVIKSTRYQRVIKY